MTDIEMRIAALEQQSRRQYLRHINAGGVGKLVLTDDTGSAQKLQIKMPMGELIDGVPNTQQFGFASNMPPSGDVSITFLEGNRSKGLVTATGHQTYRPRNTPVGGVVIYDANNQTITLDANATVTINGTGTVIIKAATKVRVEAPELECTGEVTAMCDGNSVKLSTHKQSNVMTGGGESGAPVPNT